jgi:hypothetical protein
MVGDISMVDYIEKIKKIPELEDLKKRESSNLSGTYIFFSFDLVNSTFYKNRETSWANTYSHFFEYCKTQVRQYCFPKAQVWKMVGDEVLFYMPISDESEIKTAPDLVYQVLQESIKYIYEKYPVSKGILSVKATLWAANISDIDAGVNDGNILIKERFFDNYVFDFLGPDIDIGFRISKYSLRGMLVVDAKLACLLTKLNTELDQNSISDLMRIVSYEPLKGVWDDRPYPIVWYCKSWPGSDSMFVYDERYNSLIVERIISSGFKSLESVSKLTKIFTDLNRIEEIGKLQKGISEYTKNNPKGFILKRVPPDRLSELHLVAICINEKMQVLVAKRTQKDVLSEKWEFGCSQLHLNQTFSEAMIDGYKKDFGLELSFFEEIPKPISQYRITKEKENNRVVPGLIFVARVDSSQYDEELLDKNKHSEACWFPQAEALKLNEADCVSDFHDSVNKAFQYVEDKSRTS